MPVKILVCGAQSFISIYVLNEILLFLHYKAQMDDIQADFKMF
jgi:hypothetical protein